MMIYCPDDDDDDDDVVVVVVAVAVALDDTGARETSKAR